MNRALLTSKLLNSKLLKRSSLLEVLLLVTSTRKPACAPEPYCDRNMVVHHPLLQEVKEGYTNFALQHCLRQYMLSHAHRVVYRNQSWTEVGNLKMSSSSKTCVCM
jgi:hypothetical protein